MKFFRVILTFCLVTHEKTRAVRVMIKAEISEMGKNIATYRDEETKNSLTEALLKKEREKKVHSSRSSKFYSLKRKYRKECMKKTELEAVTMDFQKNLPTLNITTSDVYYRHQLNFISFNMHVLSDSTSHMMRALLERGPMMYAQCWNNVLSSDVRHFVIFCYSCTGQNKNYTVLCFLHYLVHERNSFDSVKVVFPICGRSYTEGDKDMSLVNAKSYTETPDDWRDSRIKPSPFKVVNCATEVNFKDRTEFLLKLYKRICPMPTRSITIMKIDKEQSALWSIGYHTRLWIRGSRVQTRPGSMDFFRA